MIYKGKRGKGVANLPTSGKPLLFNLIGGKLLLYEERQRDFHEEEEIRPWKRGKKKGTLNNKKEIAHNLPPKKKIFRKLLVTLTPI